MKRFAIRIECEAILSVDDLWPDGDAPENPTAKDARSMIVAFMLQRNLSLAGLIREWHLADDADVHVWLHDSATEEVSS